MRVRLAERLESKGRKRRNVNPKESWSDDFNGVKAESEIENIKRDKEKRFIVVKRAGDQKMP